MVPVRFVALACGVVLAAVTTSAARQVLVPEAWKHLRSAPVENSAEWNCAERTVTTWEVAFDGGRLDARPMVAHRERDDLPYPIDFDGAIEPPPAGPDKTDADERAWAISFARDRAGRRVAATRDGWLIGFHAGEYGGSLWSYPARPGPGVRISGRTVSALIENPDHSSWFALLDTGYDFTVKSPNPRVHAGSVLAVGPDADGVWRAGQQVELQGGPLGYAVDSTGIVIGTRRSVEHLSWLGDLRVLSSARSPDNGAGSVALGPHGEIAVGVRFFVHLLVPDGDRFSEEWLVPTKCTRFRTTDLGCTCTGPAS